MTYYFKGLSGCLVETGGHRHNQAAPFEGDHTHPERDGGGSDQGRRSGSRGKQKETGNALKVESKHSATRRLAHGKDLGVGRREVKEDARVCGLSY